MKLFSIRIITAILLTISFNTVFAQDDMLNLLDSIGGKKNHEKSIATFKGSKIINAQTTETVKAKTCDFSITHRFGNIGVKSNGGGHTLYGLDNITDVRFGFDFGITNDFTLGIGRSKQEELLDGFVKWRLLSQTTDYHVPFSLAFYGDMSYNPREANLFYNGIDPATKFEQKTIQRIAYNAQLIFAIKLGWRFSMELIPSYQHRNYVLANINPDNGAIESNELFSMGGGFRFKFTNRVALIVDYFHNFSEYRTNNSAYPFYNPLAIGLEIETGGHVFHLNFTNASGIIENNFLVNTTDDWLKGGYKFGFNISRVFNLPQKKHKKH